ncbi:MAG: right-handed parallel beta-helix repeat-containing protein [Planctomycetota bacterium]|jgi:hypothetical protein
MQAATKRFLTLTTAAVVVLASCYADVPAAEETTRPPIATFFVGPDGDDANPGTEEKPFATIVRARDEVRKKIAAGLERPIVVHIIKGTYRITKPIVFGPKDGGTDEFAVSYVGHEAMEAPADAELPLISGGRVITGWKVQDDGTWTTVIPEVREGKWHFRELFVDGRRATRARHPNEGYLRVEKVGEDRRTNFRFAEGDLRAYSDLDEVELVFLHDWSITRTPVKEIDEATRTLRVPHQIGGPSRWAVMDWFEKQPRYYLENSAKFLDAPGEWHLSRKTGVLRYRPRPGERPDDIEVIAPVARQLLVVRGRPDENRPVRNLEFANFNFEHAAWSPPGGVYWGRQACTYWTPDTVEAGKSHEEADPAAVHFELAESCRLVSCQVAHVGRTGIWLARGCRNNRAAFNHVFDCGGNGISIGEGQARRVGDAPWWQAAPEQAASGNEVLGNTVEHCGRELFGAVGIWVGLAGKTTIECNEVRHVPYTGVSVGWMWWNPRDRPEPRKTPCAENVVADNHIHHVMQTLSDGGGIYTLGTQPGSALRGNLIHDVRLNAGRAESNGMFLDQGTGEFVIENNVIYNIDRSPLRFHKGWKNLVRNNTLEVGDGVPTVRYNDTVEERIRLENNTVVASEADMKKAIEEAQKRTGPTRLHGFTIRGVNK